MNAGTLTGLAARRPGWAPWALALLLHLLLWWAWRQASGPVPLTPLARRYPPMVWLRQPALPPQPAPTTAAAADAAVHRAAVDRPRRAGPAPAAPAPDRAHPGPGALAAGQLPGPAPAQTEAQTTAQTAAPTSGEPAASAPAHSLMLDTPATRQALRQMARQPLLAERAAGATGIALQSGADRQAQAASAAGKGDCLKGEYFGAGAGLLSAPFLIAAATRGQCRSH